MSNVGEAKTRRVRRVAIAGRPTLWLSHGVIAQGGRGPIGPPARA